MKRLISWFPHLKIQSQLMVSYLVIIIIPLTVLYIVLAVQLNNSIVNQTVEGIDGSVASVSKQLSGMMSSVSKIDAQLITNYDFMSSVTTLDNDARNYIRQQKRDIITKTITGVTSIGTDVHISLFVPDDFFEITKGSLFNPVSEIENQPWYNSLVEERNNVGWVSGDSEKDMIPDLQFIRVVYNVNDLHEFGAVFSYTLRGKDLMETISWVKNIDQCQYWICDEHGTILTGTTQRQPAQPGLIYSYSWQKKEIDGSLYLLKAIPVNENYGLYFIIAVPVGITYSVSNQIIGRLLLSSLIFVSLALGISISFSKRYTNTISSAITQMKRVQRGEMEKIETEHSPDEFGDFIENYNYMIERINELVNQRYELGREAQQHEIVALQDQVSPHFLYNMLDVINLTALEKGDTEIAEMILTLARFYRLSLNKGKMVVPLRDELEHVSLYFSLQKRRFGDRIRLAVDMEDRILDVPVLKIVLQPLVENAIIHGILSQRNRNGLISIHGWEQENRVNICVEDDGIGISQELWTQVLRKDGGGYGLYNVNRRLCIYYGPDSGLKLTITPENHTIICFSYPIPIDKI